MNEIVYSGIGAQSTDQKIVSVGSSRPLWLLRPLPLSQVNPAAYGGWDGRRWRNSYAGARGRPDSLVSCCLGVISQNMHEYGPDTLDTMEPALVEKIMTRVLADRGVCWSSARSRQRPDDATLWSFIVLNDPAGAARDVPSHTLELPTKPTLQALPPSRHRTGLDAVHPLIAVPYLFRKLNSDYAFLTTLQLDGLDDSVNDTTILGLRYATHLTCLWTRGCRTLTDAGIRMLSSSLSRPNDVEDAQGLWRLRAWYLTGCPLVGDAAMKSFAKWPGLVLLDVRETSCTAAAVDIYNRANASLWGGAQPPFQTCTDGLMGLFANDEPDAILEKLAQTLIKPDIPDIPVPDTAVDVGGDSKNKGRTYLSLHVVPSYTDPPEECLPDPRTRSSLADTERISLRDAFGGGGVYRHGMGVMYGYNARGIVDEARAKRERVALALELQAEDEAIAAAIARGEVPPERRFDRERRERAESREFKRQYYKDESAQRKAEKRGAESFDDQLAECMGGKSRRGNSSEKVIAASPVVFRDAAMEAEARSRAFVKGRRTGRDDDAAEVRGDPSVMLVRMVSPDWESMRYAARAAEPTQVRAKRRAGASEGIADMLMASQNVRDWDAPTAEIDVPAEVADVKPDAAELAMPYSPGYSSQDTKPSASQLAASVRLSQSASQSPQQRPQSQSQSRSPASPQPYQPPVPTVSHSLFPDPSHSQPRPRAQQPSFNPFRAAKAPKHPSGVTRLEDHIRQEIKTEPGESARAVPLAGGVAKSGVVPLKSGTSKNGVVPLTSGAHKGGAVPLKSGVTPSNGGVTPLKHSVIPLKSAPAKTTQTTTRTTQQKPTAKSTATTAKKNTPKVNPAPHKKETQTKLRFFTKPA